MTLPDGTNPSVLMLKWGSWVTEALDMMDGDGTFSLTLTERRDAPAYDLSVLRCARAEWVRLRNVENKRTTDV